ncbi:hypothetical protein RRG08_061151 [Elysia crispata]|uniref:Uncharacterized protein n=1 Tax=Elysia crispata TaxID=231223 RepID=A0AAE0XDJ6_9GAST|nr:hypothetical protein RRG08_061151 [Elysia crispata]
MQKRGGEKREREVGMGSSHSLHVRLDQVSRPPVLDIAYLHTVFHNHLSKPFSSQFHALHGLKKLSRGETFGDQLDCADTVQVELGSSVLALLVVVVVEVVVTVGGDVVRSYKDSSAHIAELEISLHCWEVERDMGSVLGTQSACTGP